MRLVYGRCPDPKHDYPWRPWKSGHHDQCLAKRLQPENEATYIGTTNIAERRASLLQTVN